MMPFLTLTRRLVAPAAVCAVLLVSSPVHAGQLGSSFVLLGKNWAIGYAIVFLCILLGLLAVSVSSMRKVLRKRDGY